LGAWSWTIEKRKAPFIGDQHMTRRQGKICPLIFKEGLPFNLLDGWAYNLKPMVQKKRLVFILPALS
jgi:hypothetical protein